MWIDKGLYWAQAGDTQNDPVDPPTKKTIRYHEEAGRKIAVGYWDDDQYTAISDPHIEQYLANARALA